MYTHGTRNIQCYYRQPGTFHSRKCGGFIVPLPAEQWFLKAKFELARMEEGVRLMMRKKGLAEEKVWRILRKQLSKKLKIWGVR
jgi:hypothetical protein